MEYKLKDSGKQFQQVLESRKQSLKAQNQRTRLFGNDGFDEVDIGVPQTFTTAPSTPAQQSTVRFDEENPSERVVPTSASIAFQQQRQLIPDTQYLRSRVEAINTVESHIAELGKVMGALAAMVSEHDHLVDEFGNNVAETQRYTRSGFLQLEAYFDSIKGNKRLVQRLFGVVVMFMLFFLFFLA
jgi:syntaxin 5